VIFPLAAAVLTIVLDGMPLRSYNKPYIDRGHVMVPIEPYVTALAASIEYDGRALIVRRGDAFAQVPMASAPPPGRYLNTYVAFASIARTLGAQVRFDARTQTLYVQLPPAAFATPTPFNAAVPRVAPTAVFTPSPAQTARPAVTGSPLPRRTPVPVQAQPSPVPQDRAGQLRAARIQLP
jgi:hypothetical protein